LQWIARCLTITRENGARIRGGRRVAAANNSMLFGIAWGITTLAVLANILNDSIYDIKYDNVGCNTRGLCYNQDEFS
jgi:hypothetical protein